MSTGLTLNKSYQELYDKAKFLIKKDACMKFYDKEETIIPRNWCFKE